MAKQKLDEVEYGDDDALEIGLDELPEQIGSGMPLFEFDFRKTGLPNGGGNQRRINKDIAPP
ncbi:hypothetical protein pdam_00021799 [Pocillopora damicornis]|uniref:Uncharacterized protein n=1 Tax=Pocillopora damicornis TaxID=46731 RepID=A0A3M6UNN2_POCDA|nr:hypothetical protein pdam_00021799 [Pocillopora damicornis]